MASDPLSIENPSPGVRQYQSNFRFSSALHSPSATSTSHPSLSQDFMKSQILREFKGSAFRVDLTAEGAPFHADPDSVQTVLGHLWHHCGLTNATLLSDGVSSVDSPRFPPNGFQNEAASHEPLTHLLNAVVRAINDFPPSCPRYLKDLHFYKYGREMKEIYNSHRPLKPDALGLLIPPNPQSQNESWNDVAIFVEVKNQTKALIQQLSTYARCYLAIDRRRSFAPAIGYNHKTFEIFFFAFHRSGLSSSGPISLKTPDGFESLVKYMVGILSIPDEEAFGLDMTRIGSVFRINQRDYDIVRQICVRNSVRGRATVVYRLKLRTTEDQVNQINLRSRTLKLAKGVTTLPEQMVYKLSYQTEGHTSEGPLFSAFLGQFGIVDIVGFRTCGQQEELFGNTESLVQDGLFWDFGQGGSGAPERRYLNCTAMSFECLPLLDISDMEAGIPTPVELVETILHAMIGHYNLFLGGVLHRDVSQGNILRLGVPIERSGGRSADVLRPVFEDVDLSKCRGFLVDGDHAIKWREASRTPSSERSGTLPFMALRLLYAWDTDQPIIHTAIDDLESFLWVLVWALVHILKEFGTTRNLDIEKLAETFSSHSIDPIMKRVSILKRAWKDIVFGGLIREWFAISQDASFDVEQPLEIVFGSQNDNCVNQAAFDQLEEYCRTIYMEYIRAGQKYLENIRKYPDWKAVVEGNPGWL